MQCSACHSEVSAEVKFCPNCGKAIHPESAPTAPDHGELLQKYIPPELAKRILSAGKQIEGERRFVTILFADVSGFTAMSEQLDPEMVSQILNDCFKGLISIVLKYEGTIDKFIGDEIMAIFGAPLSHENDPERAVRCSVEMISYIGRFNSLSPIPLPAPLDLHIGLNSGIVVAGNVGSDLRMNYSVVGDTVNLAARLVDLAPNGDIYCSQDTYNLVTNIVEADGPKPTQIKGKKEPVGVYSITDVKKQIAAKPPTAGKSFVGREREVTKITQSLEELMKKREVRVFVRGEAGVGKSRLKDELIRLAQTKRIPAFEGRCSSMEVHTPYYLWNTFLKNLLKVGPEASESETRNRLHDSLQILSLETLEPYLATLLSLRYEEILLEEDKQRKGKIFESVRKLLQLYAQRQPTVFILEDLHWIDRFSQELLEYLFNEESLAQAMFFVLFRGEYSQAKMIMRYGELIDLSTLSAEETGRLIKSRLDVDDVPAELKTLIMQRSEGNPFFTEEIIKVLLEKKAIEAKNRTVRLLSTDIGTQIPGTVQAVIMTRIDKLEEKIKQLVFGASVIGREFSRPILEHVLENTTDVLPGLKFLDSIEIVLEKEEAKELEYLFKHYLIQEVAYNTILQKRRKQLHALIAKAIEQLYGDRLKEFYEILAFHYEKAEEWEKASEYLSRAGRKVRELYTKEESQQFMERKEIAMEKLYEAASEKRMGWIIVSILTAILIAPLAATMFLVPFYIAYMVWLMPPYIELSLWGSEVIGSIAFYLYLSILFFGYPWIGLLFTYFGLIPIFSGRPKSYDILEDQIQISFKKNKVFSIPFTNIDSISLLDLKKRSARSLASKILDPFCRLPETKKLTPWTWLRHVVLNVLPPYSFGFSSRKGEVVIYRKKGLNQLRLFLPWLNTARRNKILSLSPTDPNEFYEQLSVSFKKWQATVKQ